MVVIHPSFMFHSNGRLCLAIRNRDRLGRYEKYVRLANRWVPPVLLCVRIVALESVCGSNSLSPGVCVCRVCWFLWI